MLQVYDFSNELDYTRLNTEVSANKGKLSLTDNPSQTFIEDFADDTGFTYDSNLVEFSAGTLQKKDQTSENALLGVNFKSGFNLNWHKFGGSLVGTQVGTPNISNEQLACSGSDAVYYERTSTALETHKVIYKPDYNSPPTNVNILSGWNGTNHNDRFHLTNSPSGNNFRMTVFNNSGGSVTSVTLIGGTINFTQGQEYEIMVTLDSVNGIIRVFVDGTLHGTLTKPAWSRGGVATRNYLGACSAIYDIAEGTFDDYMVFDNIQETASYPAGYTMPDNIYASSVVNIPVMNYSGLGVIQSIDEVTKTGTNVPSHSVINNGTNLTATLTFEESSTQEDISNLEIGYTGQKYSSWGYFLTNQDMTAKEILSFISTMTEIGNNKIYFAFNKDNVSYYHNGSSWVESTDIETQNNTYAEVQANISTLLSENQEIKVHTILKSEDGSETPLIDEIAVGFTFGGILPASVQFSKAFFYCMEADGQTPIEGVEVTIEVAIDEDEYCEAGGKGVAKIYKKTSDANGYVFFDLPWTSEYDSEGEISYKFSAYKEDEYNQSKKDGDDILFTIADVSETNIADRLSMAAG